MYLNFNSLQTKAFYFKEQLWTSLTPQQRKILVVVTLALSSIAAICLFCKCYFKAKEIAKDNLDDTSQKAHDLKEKIDPKVEQAKEDAKVEEPQPKEEVKTEQSEEDPKVELKAEKLKEETKVEPKVELPKEETKFEPKVEQPKEETKVEQPKEEPKVDTDKDAKVDTKTEETEEQPKTAAEKAPDESIIEKEDNSPAEPVKEKIVKDENTRNILIIGRSRSGKTTLRKVLENYCEFAENGSLFYSTREPELHASELSGYKFRVLDTPGLCETAPIGQTKRENTEIVQLIKEKVKEHFGGEGYENVDTVIMTFSVEGGINSNDIESLKTFLPDLPATTKKILLITRAEMYNDEKQEAIRNQISQHIELSKLVDTYFRGKENILFSGCLDSFDMRYKQLAEIRLNKIYANRELLIRELLPVAETEDHQQARFKDAAVKFDAFFNTHYPEGVDTEEDSE